MKTVRLLLGAAMLCLLAAFPAVQTAQAATVHVAHPIQINSCNPQRNVSTMTGFAPAYYPVGVGPYWGWYSVYGPRYYQYPVASSSPTLGIDYVNRTSVVMRDIEFGLLANGQLVAEVRDVGTFSPGIEIKHEFGLNRNVFPLRTGLPQCVPLKITFADGTKWRNPHLPALRREIYAQPH